MLVLTIEPGQGINVAGVGYFKVLHRHGRHVRVGIATDLGPVRVDTEGKVPRHMGTPRRARILDAPPLAMPEPADAPDTG